MSHTPWLGVAMARFCGEQTVTMCIQYEDEVKVEEGDGDPYSASVLQDGSRQNSTRHLRHVVFDFNSKLLDVRVQVEVCIFHLWEEEDS